MANKKLSAIITIGGEVAGSLRTAIGSTTTQLGKIGSEIKRVKKNQALLGESIRTFGSMGKNVDNLRARYSSVTDELNRLTKSQEKLNRVESARLRNQEKFQELKSQIGATVATAVTFGAPIVMAANFETSMLTVAKQMDGARDDAGNLTKEYYAMEQQIKVLGREFPTAIGDIAQGVGNAFKQGVAKNEVINFTRTMLKMADAMELPVEQLTEDMGKIGIMYKRANEDIGDLADTINYLDDNALSTSGDIIGFMKRVGGTASMVKIADKQVAAIGSTFLTLGEREETAATAFNAVLSKLGAANTQSKPFLAMLDQIGIKSYEIGNMMQKDAMGGIFTVMDAIDKLPDESKPKKIWIEPKLGKNGKVLKPGHFAEEIMPSKTDAIATLFGAEHWDTFAKIKQNRAELEKQLAWANDGAAKGSVNKEYEARLKTTNAQWGIAKNRVVELGINIGSVLLPAVNSILGGIGSVVSTIADWSQANPMLTKTIVGVAVALGIFKVGLLVARLALVAIKSPMISTTGLFTRLAASGGVTGKVFQSLSNPLGLLRSGFGAIIPIMKQIGFVLLRTPWGVVAAAAIAAGVMIYKYWDRVKAFFSGFWTGLKQGLEPAIKSFTDLYKSMTWLEPVIQMIGNGIGIVYDWFSKLIAPTKATDEQLRNATSAGESFGKIVGGAINIALAPAKALMGVLEWIHKHIGGVIGQVADLANKAPSVGNFFGSVKSTFGFGASEQKKPQASRSVPYRTAQAPQIRGAVSAKPSITQHFNQPITIHAAPGQSPDQVANMTLQKLNRANAVAQRGSMIDAGYSQ